MEKILSQKPFNRLWNHFLQLTHPQEILRLDGFMDIYLSDYRKKDIRVVKQAIEKFKSFMQTLPEPAYRLTPEIVRMFADHLSRTSKGSGAHSIYARFKKVVAAAQARGVIRGNPCRDIKCGRDSRAFTKDILSEEEISRLSRTPVSPVHKEIKAAFLFCLYTGMRFCDIRRLKYRCIDIPNMTLRFSQEKTRGRSCNEFVQIPLRQDTLPLLGLTQGCDPEAVVFKLPSHPTCNKVLKEWTRNAGITKHITWHCARHSFATNLLKNGADIKVVAELLGHSGLKYVEIYTRAVDSRKISAINSLCAIP